MQHCGSLSRFNGVTGSRRAKMTHKNRKKLIKRYSKKFSAIFFSFNFSVIRTLNSNWIRIPIHLKCWIWIRIQWIRIHISGWVYDVGCWGIIFSRFLQYNARLFLSSLMFGCDFSVQESSWTWWRRCGSTTAPLTWISSFSSTHSQTRSAQPHTPPLFLYGSGSE